MKTYNKPYLLDKYKDQNELTLVVNSTINSLYLNCSFYKTKFDNIYITDSGERDGIDLEVEKGMYCIFYKGEMYYDAIYISSETLKDSKIFNKELTEFSKTLITFSVN